MPLPHDCALADERKPSVIFSFSPEDEHVQRVALDAKMAELALLQREVDAGRIDPGAAADRGCTSQLRQSVSGG
jgi:hypothetical protein